MVTKAVTLACDTPAAATQAPGICSLQPLGLGPLSTAAIMPPSLSVPIVHGQSAKRPLLSPPSPKDVASVRSCWGWRLTAQGGRGMAEGTELQLPKNTHMCLTRDLPDGVESTLRNISSDF